MGIRKLWVAVGLGAVVALLAAGVVVAQSTDDRQGTFLDRVAQKLGIDPGELEQAIEDTHEEDLDAAVERGDITQEQADRLKERIDSGEWPGPFGHDLPGLPFGPGAGPHYSWDHHGPGPLGPPSFEIFGFSFGRPGQIEDLAAFLGIGPERLHEELSADGATLARVAEAHGKSRDELKSFLSQRLGEKLAQAVEEGKLPQDMADDIRTRVDGLVDRLIDAKCHVGFGRDGGFHFEWRHRPGDRDGAWPGSSDQRGHGFGRS